MDTLRVRCYNVLFGDALLVSVPDADERGKATLRHILIDTGNAAFGEEGDNDVFDAVIEDVLSELDGRPLDLYVMTHEHMDHVQGLPYAAEALTKKLSVSHAWLTASSSPTYYRDFPDARKAFRRMCAVYDAMAHCKQALPAETRRAILPMLLNNDYSKTAECVRYLRGLARKTHYVYNGCPLAGTHPFRKARFDLWAPERDTSVYYGRYRPMAFGADGARALGTDAGAGNTPIPPAGVDMTAFYDLVRMRAGGVVDNLLAIDKARNNSSIVFLLTWRGWRLLFAGDAEIRSWRTMDKRKLKPVHFLKVSHHGSRNGTPPADLLDRILPRKRRDNAEAVTLVSTCEGAYPGAIPDDETLRELALRSTVERTDDRVAPGGYFDLCFEPD